MGIKSHVVLQGFKKKSIFSGLPLPTFKLCSSEATTFSHISYYSYIYVYDSYFTKFYFFIFVNFQI